MATNPSIELQCDASPLTAFIELLQCALESRKRPLGRGDLPAELARLEAGDDATRAGQLRVRLYPSDALLRFAAACWAGDGDGRH
jgi:hypothetical protein